MKKIARPGAHDTQIIFHSSERPDGDVISDIYDKESQMEETKIT